MNPCRQCGKPLAKNLPTGAKCGECLSRENLKDEQRKAQRLAGQIPPKGSSV